MQKRNMLIRISALLLTFLTLSAMAGCPSNNEPGGGDTRGGMNGSGSSGGGGGY